MYGSGEERLATRDRRPRSTSIGQLPPEDMLGGSNDDGAQLLPSLADERRQRRAAHWWGRLLNSIDRPDAKGGHGNLLLYLTILGAVVGLVAGWAASVTGPSKTTMELLGFPGEILLSMLRALVVPLIMSSIVVGITSLGSASNMGHLSLRALLYYGLTTIVSAIFGLFWVLLIQPGTYAEVPTDGSVPNAPQKTPLESMLDIIRSLFPPNLFKAAVDMNVLGIITFSIALGVVLIMMGDKGHPLIDFFNSFNEAIMRIVGLVIWCVPIGICSLIIAKLGHDGNFWAKLEQLSVFVVTVVLGLGFHMFVFLPCVYAFIVRKNPFVALLIALGTASSSATLPVTIKCCEDNNGISQRVARFVLPLGATMNMNGTALYEAVACIFMAQALGVELSFAQIVITALTATLAAIGAAGIPEAGLVTLIMVLTAVGLPLEGIGLLFSIDWFLDRLRTTVNVFGDAVGAAIVDHWEAKKFEDLELDDPFADSSSSSKEGSGSSSTIGEEDSGVMTPIFSSERVYPRYHTTPSM